MYEVSNHRLGIGGISDCGLLGGLPVGDISHEPQPGTHELCSSDVSHRPAWRPLSFWRAPGLGVDLQYGDLWLDWIVPGAARAFGPPRENRLRRSGSFGHSQDTVSYTHLRAHE